MDGPDWLKHVGRAIKMACCWYQCICRLLGWLLFTAL